MIHSFPWHTLPRVSAQEVRSARLLRQYFSCIERKTVEATLSEWVGHSFQIELRKRWLLKSERVELYSQRIPMLLRSPTHVLLIEVEAELILAVVGGLAGRKQVPRIAKNRQVDAELIAAFASAIQYLTRSHFSPDFELVAWGTMPNDIRSYLGVDEIWAFDFLIRIGALRSLVRAITTIPEVVETTHIPAMNTLLAMNDTPITLQVVLAASRGSAHDFLTLEVGDLVVLDELKHNTQCVLAPAESDLGIEGQYWSHTSQVQLGTHRVELICPLTPNEDLLAMKSEENYSQSISSSTSSPSSLSELLADMNVVVRIEAGSVTLPAREWASLSTGDVVVLDRRVGDHVTLRINGKIAGRGELVEVDGILGVRVVERI